MTSFRFNFSKEESNIEENAPKEIIRWFDSEEIKANSQIKCLDEIAKHAKMFTYKDLEIGHVVPNEVISNMDASISVKNELKLAEDSHSDLITGKYEGGLKLWECTNDLLEYLVDNVDASEWNKSRVLDLGCGAGLLGILSFLNGGHVTFQDYNKEVLEWITIPNVLLNIEEETSRESEIEKCKFYSGDWDCFNKLLGSDESFDYILTSETIYNPENYSKIIDILSNRLKDKGTAFVAAKTHYFGVGGGVRQFESCLHKSGSFCVELCWKTVEGIQREILKITKK